MCLVQNQHRRDYLTLKQHPDYLMSRFQWLDRIGRETRSHKDEKLENFLTQVQRLTLTHENAENGETEVFKFGTGSTPAEGSAQHTQGHQQEQKKKEEKRVEEGNNPESAMGQKKDQTNKGEHAEDDRSSDATKRDSDENQR